MPSPLRIALLAAAVAVVLASGSGRAGDAGAVKDRLDKAKQEYDAETAKFRRAVSEALDKSEDAARRTGNKKAVDAVKASRDGFEKDGQLPPDAPRAALALHAAARAKLDKAYSEAVRDLVKKKEDDAAAAVEKEQNQFVVEAALALGRRTHLSSLKAFDVRVSNNTFENDTGKFRMGGDAVPHSVFLHPRSNSFATASYPLGGRMTVFRSGVGVPRHPGIAGHPATPLVFEVLGDGKSLWKSEPVGKLDEFQTCAIRVEKVKTLTLRVSCPGDEARAHAVWFGPVAIE